MKSFLLCVLLSLLFANLCVSEECPKPKTITIKREHIKEIPVSIPYPHYQELPEDAKFLRKCPPKFKKEGDKCIHTIKSTDVCPKDYSRVSDKTCMKVVLLDKPEDHVTHCPNGYKLDAKVGCVVTKEHQKQYPDVPTFVVPQEPKIKVPLPIGMKPLDCPQGYERKSNYRCSKIVRCETGKVLKNGQCIISK
jgi:hypothetical protein